MKQFGLLILFAFFAAPIVGQSVNENFPTPVVQSEISGTIAARDVGDARLTRHFYTFFVDNGDLNLAIETTNFDGDLDLFESQTLRPLTKITIAAATSAGADKTNRLVYFRKREQVVLRIEGKSLTDQAAQYRIVFSGSFAATELPESSVDDPKVAQKSGSGSSAKVSSAGTILEVLEPEKADDAPLLSTPPAAIAKTAPVKKRKGAVNRKQPAATTPRAPKAVKPEENAEKEAAEIKREEPINKPVVKTPQASNNRTARNKPVKTPSSKKSATVKKPTAETQPKASAAPDPLANVRLVILLKNGDQIERQMSEVFNFNVDKGQVTIITKNGKIERYNLLEVQKLTIE